MNTSCNFFTGTDTQGKRVNVAIRRDGKQFYRVYGFNGFGNGYSKWIPISEPCKIESFEDNTSRLEWGFVFLSGSIEKVRLPK